MASADEYLLQSIETDNASLIHRSVEESCYSVETEKHIAGYNREFCMKHPPHRPVNKSDLSFSECYQGIDYFQSAQKEAEMGIGSDSADEEYSPFGSPNNKKYEMMAVSGKDSSEASRKQRLIPNATDETTEETQQQITFALGNGNMEQQSGPYAEEKACSRGAFEALAMSGLRTEKTASKEFDDIYVRPRGEIHSSVGNRHFIHGKEAELAKVDREEDMYKDINIRLATFLSYSIEWPHKTPSAEMMAAAGLIFKGVFKVGGTTINDMVECYKCKGRLYGFTRDDDPVEEHKREYPNCN